MPIPITIRDYRLLLNTKIPNQNQIPKFLVKNDQFLIQNEFWEYKNYQLSNKNDRFWVEND